jgi:hypothetical protein
MDKNQYKFYISYWESYKLLKSDKEKVEFIDIINKIHFFEEHIDTIEVKNTNVKLLFASIKHSLKASIQGYCDKKEMTYDSMFDTPLATPLITPLATIYNKQHTINNKQQTTDKEKWFLSLEDDIYKQPIIDWLNYRTKLTKKEQWEYQYKVLKKFGNPNEVVAHSIGTGYQGLYEPKNNKTKSFTQGDRNL